MTIACTRSWVACWVRYGLIFLMFNDAKRHDWATEATWPLKVQLVINHDTRVSGYLWLSKRWGFSLDADALVCCGDFLVEDWLMLGFRLLLRKQSPDLKKKQLKKWRWAVEFIQEKGIISNPPWGKWLILQLHWAGFYSLNSWWSPAFSERNKSLFFP